MFNIIIVTNPTFVAEESFRPASKLRTEEVSPGERSRQMLLMVQKSVEPVDIICIYIHSYIYIYRYKYMYVKPVTS